MSKQLDNSQLEQVVGGYRGQNNTDNNHRYCGAYSYLYGDGGGGGVTGWYADLQEAIDNTTQIGIEKAKAVGVSIVNITVDYWLYRESRSMPKYDENISVY